VFDSFPWPQEPTAVAVAKVAREAIELRALRRKFKAEHDLSLRELYRSLELPGAHPLKDAHTKLDQAVREAYGMPKNADPLAFLLKLNAVVAAKEEAGETVLSPGLPPTVKDRTKFVTADCLRMST
jgi:hypothetical protein